MKRSALYLSVAGIALLLAWPAAGASQGRFVPAPEGTRAVPGRYLVQLEELAVGSPPGKEAARGVRELTGELETGYTFRTRRIFSAALTGFAADMTEAEARRLARHPFVARVQQDYAVKAISATTPQCSLFSADPVDTRPLPGPVFGFAWKQSITCASPPNDCIDNWGLDRIDQHGARNGKYVAGASGAGTYIVVFDTGANGHREWQNLSGASRVSSLSKSFVTQDPTDIADGTTHGHGTHVTGIAAGRTYGVAKLANIVVARVCTPSGNCFVSHLIAAFEYIAGLKASFPSADAVGTLSANNSAWKNDAMLVACVNGLIASGVQLIQSAGNQGSSACTYSFGGVTDTFVVAGTDSTDTRYNFAPGNVSNYGGCVDIFAPAQQIVSASKKATNKYCQLTGTSMAAPHVAGVAALYLEQNPGATPAQLRSWLISNATTGAVSNPGPGSPNRLLYTPY